MLPLPFGATDEFGYKVVENKVAVRDFHATLLLGIDHEALTFNHHGLDHRLAGVEEAHVIRELIA